MDSNKNQECYYSNGGEKGGGLTVVIGTDCIAKAKAVSATKYQNQFNNNNLIEQENLMPPVQDRVDGMGQDVRGGGGSPSTNPIQQNGLATNGESPGMEKVHLAVNGSARHLASSIFTQPSPPVPAGSDASTVPSSVECFHSGNGTTSTIASFNPALNGTSAHECNGYVAVNCNETASTNGTSESTTEFNPLEGRSIDDAAVNEPPDDEGDFSDNNSLGNLSYVSENGELIEEIILLPNNAFSDDDNASTSDDCIYAYRGGEPAGAAGQLLDLQGDLPPDDETDFLEMDFDPEPSSEMENFNRQQDNFLLGLEGEQYQTARPTDHGQEGGAGSGARSPAQPAGGIEQMEAARPGSGAAEPHETGLLHQAKEANEGKALFTVPAPSVAQLDDPKPKLLQENRAKSGDTVIAVSKTDPEPAGSRLEAHKTGAIPKNLPIPVDRSPLPGPGLSSSSKNLRLDLAVHSDEPDFVETHRYQDCSLYYYQPAEFAGSSTSKRSKGLPKQQQQEKENDTEEMHCLDCAEQEFLMRTKQDPTRQRYCNVCSAAKGMRSSFKGDHRAARSYDRDAAGSRVEAFYTRTTDPRTQQDGEQSVDDELLDLRAEQIVFETLHKINTLKEMPPHGGVESKESSIKLERETEDDPTKWHHDQIVPLVTDLITQPEQSVTLYTMNCNEVTIAEAFMHFGLSPKESVLRQYANERYETDDAKMTIPQYLLHMSKRNCNYKKLIDVIKACCDTEPLDVQYYPIDPFSDAPEVVQICSSEIAKRWNANTNLRQIIHFKHKHFHTLNVLGKIVNILRQPSRGRDTNYMISIPQYYKSGIIKIRRIATASTSPTW